MYPQNIPQTAKHWPQTLPLNINMFIYVPSKIMACFKQRSFVLRSTQINCIVHLILLLYTHRNKRYKQSTDTRNNTKKPNQSQQQDVEIEIPTRRCLMGIANFLPDCYCCNHWLETDNAMRTCSYTQIPEHRLNCRFCWWGHAGALCDQLFSFQIPDTPGRMDGDGSILQLLLFVYHPSIHNRRQWRYDEVDDGVGIVCRVVVFCLSLCQCRRCGCGAAFTVQKRLSGSHHNHYVVASSVLFDTHVWRLMQN